MIFKIVGLCIITLVLSTVLKSSVPWLTPYLVTASCICILILCFADLTDIFGYFYDICDSNRYGEYFKVMIKGLGVSYIACIGSDLCRDCGENQLASRVEQAAKIEIFLLAFPLVKNLIELSESILS